MVFTDLDASLPAEKRIAFAAKSIPSAEPLGVVVAAQEVKTLAGQTSKATNEIAASAASAGQGAVTVTRDINEVNQSATETDRAAHAVVSASAELNQKAEFVQARVRAFVDQIRAA